MATETKPVVLKPETRAVVEKKAKTCWMCKWVLESITEDNELRNWPLDKTGEEIQFPVAGQKFHIARELES